MSRVIPNENSWIGFTTVKPADIEAPTEAELDAAFNLTPYVVSLNPTSQGNAIPTPALDSLFDRSTVGTSQGSFSGDLYRNDEEDVDTGIVDQAWKLLKRGTRGWVFVSRFGGTGDKKIPRSGETCECWPIAITQRAGSNMTSNTVETFTLTAAVPDPPSEDGVVGAASSGVPTAPRNLVATPGSGSVGLDWDAPAFVGAGALSYVVHVSATEGGVYAPAATTVVTGTTAVVTVTAGTKYYKVLAHNTAGDGPLTAAVAGVSS